MSSQLGKAVPRDVRGSAARRAVLLEQETIAYNVIEGIVAGLVAGSVALLGFGVDSWIEVAAHGGRGEAGGGGQRC